jgi:FkbM family methyltransferase
LPDTDPSVIKQAYLNLLRFGPTRRSLRAARAGLQQLCGYSDPFYDLVHIANRAGLFLDIGCHHGDTLLRFLESGLRCPVAAFDPNADNLSRAKTLLNRHRGIGFYELALSDERTAAPFYLNANDQTSSLLPNAQGNLDSFPDDTARRQVLTVQTERLDAWAQEHFPTGAAVVKCDTQGAEGAVIRGGLRFIREQVAAFYGEVMLGRMYEGQSSFEEIRRLLEVDCGLVLKNIYPCLHDRAGRAVQMDVLWVKPAYL